MTYLKGQERAAYVHAMFGRIAPHYDLINRLMTGRQDTAWRRLAVNETQLPPGGRLLDVATGTGDIALQASQTDCDALVAGVDFTSEMLRLGQAKPGAEMIRWACADALHLPFPANSFDAVISGFLMRNVADIAAALTEQRRVIRPGRRVVCLELSSTSVPLFKHLSRFYLYHLVPPIGGLISGNPEAYAYLPNSLTEFLTADELAQVMRSVGLQEVRYRRLMWGTVAIHVGIKA